MCNTFEEHPGEFFFGKITVHFTEENLWHVNYDDGDEEDLNMQEVLDAANLAITLYAQDDSTSGHDTPNLTTPVTASITAVTSPSVADQERAHQERDLGKMLNEFDDLCLEGEATNPEARQSHDVHEYDDVQVVETQLEESEMRSVVLEEDQCSWCGFRDHVRRTRKTCPQHPDYDGDVYQKGDKLNDVWLPGTRASHNSSSRQKLTPTSVRSAPLASSFTVKDWTIGVGAINERSKFDPKEFTGQSLLTYPKSTLGWTVDTPPRDLVRQFYPASDYP